jgi:hypothetical protein
MVRFGVKGGGCGEISRRRREPVRMKYGCEPDLDFRCFCNGLINVTCGGDLRRHLIFPKLCSRKKKMKAQIGSPLQR